MALSYANVMVEAEQTVQQLLSGFVEKTYGFLAETFRTPLLICVLLYVIFIGYGLLQGWFQLAWRELSELMLKFCLVVSLVFNWPFFQSVLVDFFTTGIDDVVSALTAHLFSYSDFSTDGSTTSLSQGLITEVASVGLWVWKMASFSSPLPIFLGLVLWVCGLGVVLYGAIQILISKIMITLLLASGPFLVIFVLFRSCFAIARSWLQLLFSNWLVLFMVSLALNLSFYLLHAMFDELYQSHAKGISVLQLIPIILISVLSFFMIKRCVNAAMYMGSQLLVVAESSRQKLGNGVSWIKSGLRLAR